MPSESKKVAQPFGVQDTVGCGIVYPPLAASSRGCIFFTKNGVLVHTQALPLSNNAPMRALPLFPLVGSDCYYPIEANFGIEKPFVFDVIGYENSLLAEHEHLRVQVEGENKEQQGGEGGKQEEVGGGSGGEEGEGGGGGDGGGGGGGEGLTYSQIVQLQEEMLRNSAAPKAESEAAAAMTGKSNKTSSEASRIFGDSELIAGSALPCLRDAYTYVYGRTSSGGGGGGGEVEVMPALFLNRTFRAGVLAIRERGVVLGRLGECEEYEEASMVDDDDDDDDDEEWETEDDEDDDEEDEWSTEDEGDGEGEEDVDGAAKQKRPTTTTTSLNLW